MGIFFTPENGECADFIPYYNEDTKTYELYYLHDFRDIKKMGEGCPWYRLTTKNFVTFHEDGEVLPRGGREEQDLFVYTGCVIKKDDLYHIFYTGHNHHLLDMGKRVEAVMHATSQDGLHWDKIPEDTFYAPEDEPIEKHDWRDPFVFWNTEENKWWMLLCTRKLHGPSKRRGAVGLLVSDDLKNWDYTGSLWDPSLCWAPECPDMFAWGKYWYLIYSTYCEHEGMRTYYRISDSPRGPWQVIGDGALDSRSFYAGKTVTDGQNRFLVGWNPTKDGNRDCGVNQWGGHLIAHQLIQHPNGKLSVSMPSGIASCFDEQPPRSYSAAIGESQVNGDSVVLWPKTGFSAVETGNIPSHCMITFCLEVSKDIVGAGVMLRTEQDLEKGYFIRFEADGDNGYMVFDSTDRWCEHPESRRKIALHPKASHRVTLLLDGTVLLAYFDNETALSARMYDFDGSHLAFFALDGMAKFSEISARQHIHR